jgi:hypothetical protein
VSWIDSSLARADLPTVVRATYGVVKALSHSRSVDYARSLCGDDLNAADLAAFILGRIEDEHGPVSTLPAAARMSLLVPVEEAAAQVLRAHLRVVNADADTALRSLSAVHVSLS